MQHPTPQHQNRHSSYHNQTRLSPHPRKLPLATLIPLTATHSIAITRARVPAQVIADIARKMGAGMAEFIEREVVSIKDYDLYCHYVAGLVGLGLAQVRACACRVQDLA